MKYTLIREVDSANGPGVRVSLFVSGCRLKCKGCFNEIAQNFDNGFEFTEGTIDKILDLCSKDYIQGLTLLGGDSLEKENQEGTLELLKAFRTKFGNSKDVWCWTGRVYDKALVTNGRDYIEGVTDEFLSRIDILVDGPFVQSLNKKALIYMGSTNQRIIDMPQTLKQGKVVLSYYDSIERR